MDAKFEIVEAVNLSGSGLASCDFSFDVSTKVVPPFDKTLQMELRVVNVEQPYGKQYEADIDSILSPGTDSECKRYLALVKVEACVRGYILVKETWNKIASLENIAVDRSLRGKGIGKALMQHALNWVKREDLTALRAETQDNNVMACRLYQRCGFRFGGYDAFLYAADPKYSHENALFWYCFVDDENI